MRTKKVLSVLEPEKKGPADPFRDRCIEAARELFFRSGFSRVTMDDLAARLGVGKATLYKVFSGKEEVLLAVVQRVASMTVSRIQSSMADPSAGFVERVSVLFRTVGALFASISPVLFEDIRRYAPHVWEAVNSFRHGVMVDNMGKLLRSGIQAGVFRDDLDVPLVLDMFISQIERHINPDAILRSGRSASDTLAAIIRVFFQGLLTEAGRSELSDRLDLRIPPVKEGHI